jgi:hypothetical protein
MKSIDWDAEIEFENNPSRAIKRSQEIFLNSYDGIPCVVVDINEFNDFLIVKIDGTPHPHWSHKYGNIINKGPSTIEEWRL